MVMRAWDLQAGRMVALKRLRYTSAALRRRFRREAMLLARVQHPAIARYLGAERQSGRDLLVMEFVAGETVKDLVSRFRKARRSLPWRSAAKIAAQLLEALEHIHRRGVIHRDIKPSNVMIARAEGRIVVKLLDMGLAKCIADLASEDESVRNLTLDGEIVGTSDYMAKEQWAGGDQVVAESDIYSLGCTLFFMLTGKPPFAGLSMRELCLAACHGRPAQPAGYSAQPARNPRRPGGANVGEKPGGTRHSPRVALPIRAFALRAERAVGRTRHRVPSLRRRQSVKRCLPREAESAWCAQSALRVVSASTTRTATHCPITRARRSDCPRLRFMMTSSIHRRGPARRRGSRRSAAAIGRMPPQAWSAPRLGCSSLLGPGGL